MATKKTAKTKAAPAPVTLTVDRRELVDVLGALRQIVPTKSRIPALVNVHVSTERDSLVIRGTDLDTDATESLRAPGATPAMFAPALLDLATVLAFLKAACGQRVTLNRTTTAVVLETEQEERLELVADDAGEFPVAALAPAGVRIELPSEYLQHALGRVLPSVAGAPGRYSMHGVLFEVLSGTFVLVGTDGRRLAVAKRNLDFIPAADVRAVLPRDTVQYLVRYLPKGDSPVVVTFPVAGSELPKVQIEWARKRLSIRPIEMEFPRYTSILRYASTFYAQVDGDELVRRLKAVSAACGVDSPVVRIQMESERLRLCARTARGAESTANVTATLEGATAKRQPACFGLNPDYLIDGVKACNGDGPIRIGMSDKASPIQLEVPGFTYAVMPITLE